MRRNWLGEQVEAGRSLEEIGREVGRHPSTVAYWLKRHGLSAAGASQFAARGAPARETLEGLAATGLSLKAIAREVDRSVATVRYWLARYGIERAPVPSRTPVDPSTAPRIAQFVCATHGLSDFVLEGRGTYRCKRCRLERVSAWRRRIKRLLVAEAGGACSTCGYGACVAALQFHHVDPSTKSFALSDKGLARSLERVRAEAAKCVLLCANCHAEVESGHRILSADVVGAPRGGFEPPRTD